METEKSALEQLFDNLFHEDTQNIKPLLAKARKDLETRCKELTMDEKRRLNFIPSLLSKCQEGRWLQARSQLETAEQEFIRFFVQRGDTGPKQGIYQLHSPRKSAIDSDRSAPGNDTPKNPGQHGRSDQAPRKTGSREGSVRPAQTLTTSKQTSDDVRNVRFASTPTKTLERVQTPADSLPGQFKKLFQNEWKTALEEFEELKIYEKSSISCLLNIVLGAYNMCRLEAENQITKMEDAIRAIMIEGINDKGQKMSSDRHLLLSYRRQAADVSIPRLQETFKRRFLPEMLRSVGMYQTVRTFGPIYQYVDRVVNICWSMAIQDPPLCLGDDRNSKNLADRNLYDVYKRSGKLVEVYVWPPVYDSDKGKLLTKGLYDGC